MIRLLMLAVLVSGCASADKVLLQSDAGRVATLLEKEEALVQSGEAYYRNSVMDWTGADLALRNATLARAGEAADSIAQAELELYFALNKSNLGEFVLADHLFEVPLELVKRSGATADKVKAFVLFAQHLRNRNDLELAADYSQLAIDMGESVLAGDKEPETAGGAPAQRVRISERASAQLHGRYQPDAGPSLSSGQLSASDRLKVLVAQAHYVQASIKPRSDDRAAHLAAASQLMETVPNETEIWLRTELARSESLASAAKLDYAPAISRASDAVSLSRLFAAKERPEALSHLLRGRVLLQGGREEDGIAAFRAGLEILAAGGRGIALDEIEAYLILLARRSDDPSVQAEIFQALQQVRNPVTANTLDRLAARLTAGTSEDARALRALQDVEREANRVAAELDALLTQQIRDVHAIAVSRARLDDLEGRAEDLGALVADIAPGFVQVTDPSVGLDDLRSVLGPQEAFVLLRLGSQSTAVAALTRNDFQFAVLPEGRDRISELVYALRDAVETGDGFGPKRFDVAAAQDLYRLTFGAVNDLVAASKEIIFAPEGPLLSLPPGLLVASERSVVQPSGSDYTGVPWLGMQKAITIALSASSHVALQQTPSSSARIPFRGYGGYFPPGAEAAPRMAAARNAQDACLEVLSQLASADPLVGTVHEVDRLHKLFGVDVAEAHYGPDFNDAAILQDDLTDIRILHFATHGLLPISRDCLPEPSLTTSLGGDGSDALLEASEIVQLDLDADLVVLSACDTGGRAALSSIGTGLGGPRGEALSGLVRSFFYAGARSVIASHWQIPDTETVTLMEHFYTSLQEGRSSSDAMREARSHLAADPESSHPFFWAAFTIAGRTGSEATDDA